MAAARGKCMWKWLQRDMRLLWDFPALPLISFSFVLWVTLGLFLNILSPTPPKWKRDVMQHPIYLETHCLQGNLNTNILILYTELVLWRKVNALCTWDVTLSVKHIPQTARFVLLFQLPSLLKLVSVCDEGWVCFSKEVLLCSRELDNKWLWETSSQEAAWSREWAMHTICIWSSMCWALRDSVYYDPLVCPGGPAHQGWLAGFSQVTAVWEVAMPKQPEW